MNIGHVFNYIEEYNMISITLRLILATMFGAMIGIERATKRRSAGLRTFALVCLGAALSTITNQYLIAAYGSGDPSRLAAQVISGIGFLGIGTIVVTGKNHVRGLTTAATLWVTATLGIALGAGFIYGSVISFILIMIIVRLLSNVSRYQEQHNRMIGIYIEVDEDLGTRQLLQFTHEKNYSISSMEKSKQTSMVGNDAVLILELDMKKKYNHDLLIAEISNLEMVHYIEEIR